MTENERQLKNNNLWFRMGIITAFIGMFMMVLDSSIEYSEKSLMYIIRPCYVVGVTIVITAMTLLIIFTIEFYNKFVKVEDEMQERDEMTKKEISSTPIVQKAFEYDIEEFIDKLSKKYQFQPGFVLKCVEDYFIQTHLIQNLGEHCGKWVAIVGTEIVSVSDLGVTVFKDAKKKYPNCELFIMKVPKNEITLL